MEIQMSDNNTEAFLQTRILFHLFSHPLFSECRADSSELSVCQFGLGYYGQLFLSAALQCGQLVNKTLSINLFSKSIKPEKKHFLNSRSALGDFFDIDKSGVSEGSYGSLRFNNAVFSGAEDNGEVLKKCIGNSCYVFVALGTDELNRKIARECQKLNLDCMICYVVRYPSEEDVEQERFAPVKVLEDPDGAFKFEIDRMAFNCHLVWSGKQNLNIDYSSEKERHFKPNSYNYHSCVSNIISIQSKLESVGITLNKEDILDPAVMLEKANRFDAIKDEYKDELAYIEHRRWVTEKLCEGYTKLPVEECPIGVTRAGKRHVCLVKSNRGISLPVDDGSDDTDLWESVDESTLDELDLVSLRIHKRNIKEKESRFVNHPLNSEAYDSLRVLSKLSKEPFAVFCEWSNCMQEIYLGKHTAVKRYNELRRKFCQAANLSENIPEIKRFEELFIPFVEALRYVDFKSYDYVLAEQIPFILTYHTDTCLVVPLVTGSNDESFENVACAMLLNPAKLILVHESIHIGANSSDAIKKQAKKRQAEIDRAVAQAKNLVASKGLQTVVSEKPLTIGQDYDCNKWREKCSKAFFQSPRTENELWLELLDRIPDSGWEEVEINSKTGSVKYGSSLKFINRPCFLTASDLASFCGANGRAVHPVFPAEEINELWKKFVEDAKNWKKLAENAKIWQKLRGSKHRCETEKDSELLKKIRSDPELRKKLDEYLRFKNKATPWKRLCSDLSKSCEDPQNKNVVLSFTDDSKCSERTIKTYILPDACYETVMSLTSRLIGQNKNIKDFRDSSSDYIAFNNNYTSNAFTLEVRTTKDNIGFFDELLGNPDLLTGTNRWTTRRITGNDKSGEFLPNSLCFFANELTVRSVDLDIFEYELLKWFADKGYVRNLAKKGSNHYSFSFATADIRHLLTNAGFILELYLFNQLAENRSRFSDIVNGYQIFWKEKENKQNNEFDLVVTKGFQSALIECKATARLDEEYYTKLINHSQTMTDSNWPFGINCISVIAAYVDHKDERLKEKYSEAVTTVWSKNALDNFAETLLKLFEENER